MLNLGSLAQARSRKSGGLIGLVGKLIVLGFGVIQLVLVARILLDLGVIAGVPPTLGQGLDPVMLAALAGWTVVEVLVLGVVRRFAAV